MSIGIRDTGLAIQNSIIIFMILLAIGPIFNIHYLQIFDYNVNVIFLISFVLSLYLVICIFIGFINIIFGKEEGMQIIMNAFIMWLPTMLISGPNNGLKCLIWIINFILSYIIHFLSRFFS